MAQFCGNDFPRTWNAVIDDSTTSSCYFPALAINIPVYTCGDRLGISNLCELAAKRFFYQFHSLYQSNINFPEWAAAMYLIFTKTAPNDKLLRAAAIQISCQNFAEQPLSKELEAVLSHHDPVVLAALQGTVQGTTALREQLKAKEEREDLLNPVVAAPFSDCCTDLRYVAGIAVTARTVNGERTYEAVCRSCDEVWASTIDPNLERPLKRSWRSG